MEFFTVSESYVRQKCIKKTANMWINFCHHEKKLQQTIPSTESLSVSRQFFYLLQL